MSGENIIRADIQAAGDIENTNPLGPRNVDAETSRPKLSTHMHALSLQPKRQEMKIERKSAPTKETIPMDMSLAFIRNRLVDHTVPIPSSYVPSSQMMYYILHCMDSLIVQNHHYTQNNAQSHPLIIRIYYGTLFYIQTLRCMNHVKILSRDNSQFLKAFLEAYPPESLAIAGPLALIFQSLTVSTSRFTYQGKIYPTIPDTSTMIQILKAKKEDPSSLFVYPEDSALLPNMYILHGFVSSLSSARMKAVAGTNDYPRSWHPFMAINDPADQNNRTVPPFNGAQVADVTAWNDEQRWILANPATCYPLESTKDQNEKFTNYGDRLNIPPIDVAAGTLDLEAFLNLSDFQWFGEVMAIATSHSKYFKSPTTLDKCPVEGPATAQVMIKYHPPRTLPTPPVTPGDVRSQFPLVYRAFSSNPELTETDQLMAFTAQLNVTMFPTHPAFGRINAPNGVSLRTGAFWDIRPISMESNLDSGFYQVKDIVTDHFYQDKPKY